MATQGISKDKVTFNNFESALREYREAHPDAVFEQGLQVTLAYGDFALRNRSLFAKQWEKAKLLAVKPREWQEMAARFEDLQKRQAKGTILGLYRESIQLYGNHLTCCWDSAGDEEIRLRFDALAAEAGLFLGSAPGFLEAIRQTDAKSWADFWKYCVWFHLGSSDSIVAEPIIESMRLCLHIALRCGAIKGPSSWDLPTNVLPPQNAILDAINDTSTALQRVPSDDPLYEAWKSFVLNSHALQADSVTTLARRVRQGKGIDPKEEIRFALAVFDSAAKPLIATVHDAESVSGCGEELRRIFHACIAYLGIRLRSFGGSRSVKKWQKKLELDLVERFAKAMKRVLKAAATGDTTNLLRASSRVPPTRLPDLETSRERVGLADKLASELALIKQEAKRYSTVESVKKKYPKFMLWSHIENAQLKELLDGEPFTPRAYADSLTLAKYGLTSRETIRKDRQKLRRAKQPKIS
jgi:hypothetical protein